MPGPLFLLAALLLQQAPLFAARMNSSHYLDISGIYGYGSAYMISPNFEQNANVQEAAASTQTQTSGSFSQRSGKLAFSPIPASVGDLAVVIVSSYSVRITWTAPSSDIGRDAQAVQDYILRYTSAGYISSDEAFRQASTFAQSWVPLEAGAGETRIIEGFSAGTTYYFSLETINSHSLRSELSNPAAAFALVPLAPMNLQLTRAGTSVTISWIPPAGYQNRIPFDDRFNPSYPYEIKGYQVYRATAPADADWSYLGETSSGTLNWTDIIGASDSYYYHARAVNQAGESIASYARGSNGGGLYFLAPDNQSIFEVSQEGSSVFYSASADPMDSYTIEISTNQEDLTGRVVKSVAFSAYRGGLEPAPSLKLAQSGTLKLFYAKAGGAIVPSGISDAKSLSMYYFNGSRWLQLYGTVNETEHSVQLRTTLLGRYQLRTTERSGSFSADKAGLSNRLITPNGDGKNDTMVFIFDNPQGTQVKGRLFDLRGAVVASMRPGPVANSLAWDAKSGGQIVPGGVYVYQIEADGTVYNGTVVVVR
jgi:hypothetical protein